MDKYENYFEMTEKLYVEVIKKMIPGGRYIMYTAAIILLGISAIVMVIGNNYFMGIAWFILAAILTFSGYFGIPMKARNIYRKRLPCLTDDKGVFWKKTSFYDTEFQVVEPQNSASFKYSDIAGVSETLNLYVILLRDKKFIFLKKDCFKDATNREFINFLMEKCNVR